MISTDWSTNMAEFLWAVDIWVFLTFWMNTLTN